MRLKWAFWDILGHFGTTWDILGHFGTLWDNLEGFSTSLEHLDRFPRHFRPFSPVIGSMKLTRDRQPAGRTDIPSCKDAWTHLKRSYALYRLHTEKGIIW